MDIKSDSSMHSGGQGWETVGMHTPVRETAEEYKKYPVRSGYSLTNTGSKAD